MHAIARLASMDLIDIGANPTHDRFDPRRENTRTPDDPGAPQRACGIRALERLREHRTCA